MIGDKRLVVNADGFGFGAGATRGILDAIREGAFVSSVSVNANFPDVVSVTALAREFPHISIGVHLNPLAGRPCLPANLIPSLVTGDGFFHAENFVKRFRSGLICFAELEAEFDAQIATVKTLAGARLTHLDSQENTHLRYFDLFLKLARKWGLQRVRNNASLICLESPKPALWRARTYLLKPQVWLAHQYRKYQMWKARSLGMRMADDLITVGYAGKGNKTDIANWLRILKNLPPGTHEIYCHPAYPDETLRRWSWYCDERARELKILRSPELRETAKKLGVELIDFDSI